MTEKVLIDPASLREILGVLPDSEAILVCRTLRDDLFPHESSEEVLRCFMTFGFSPMGESFSADTTTVQHDSTGIVLTCEHPSVSIDLGGDVRELIPDLARVLDAMGWVEFDVYSSTNPQAFFNDLTGISGIPAALDHLTPRLQEVPDLDGDSADLAGFAQVVAQQAGSHGDRDSSLTGFMDALDQVEMQAQVDERSVGGRSPALTGVDSVAAAPIGAGGTQVGMGVGVGVGSARTPASGNFVPDSDELPLARPIVADAGVSVADPVSPVMPPAAAVAPGAMAGRPRFGISTSSPVASASAVAATVSESAAVPAGSVAVTVPAGVPMAAAEAPKVAEIVSPLAGPMGVGDSSGETISADVDVPVLTPPLPLSGLGDEPVRLAAASVAPVEFVFPTEPVALGDSLVVVCSPTSPRSDAEIEALADGREVVFLEVTKSPTDRHVQWDFLSEHDDGSQDLVAAFWPMASHDHLALSALFSLAKRGDDSPSVAKLLALAIQPGDVLIGHWVKYQLSSYLGQLMARMNELHLLKPALWRAVDAFWPLVLAQASSQRSLSFGALVRERQRVLVVLRMDALDQGTAVEFLMAAAVRWVMRLAKSRRCVPNEVMVAEELAPDQQAALKMLLANPAALKAIIEAYSASKL